MMNWKIAGKLSTHLDSPVQGVNVTSIVAAEALQRFGYYGIRSILLTYLTTALGISDRSAGQVYGLFYGSLCLSSLAGGYLGDTRLGPNLVGSIGLALIFIGHLLLATRSLIGTFVALSLYSLGFGFFDPNMNVILAKRYQDDQRLRDAMYTLLYWGINLGAMLGPIICGYIILRTGWSGGFIAGGVSSLVALLLLRASNRQRGVSKASPDRDGEIELAQYPRGENAVPNYILFFSVLGLTAIVFWSVFDQLGSSVTLLAQRHAHRHFGPFEIPSGYVQSINPFLVLLLGPLVSLLIARRQRKWDRDRSIKVLFLGLIMLGTAFALLAIGTTSVGEMGGHEVSWVWILLAILLATIGELLFAPRSTSLVAKIAPGTRHGLVMGVWSATFGIGAYLSGTMSGFMNAFGSLSQFFAISAIACGMAAVALVTYYAKVTKVIGKENRISQSHVP